MEKGYEEWSCDFFYGGIARNQTADGGWRHGKGSEKRELCRGGLPIFPIKRPLPYLVMEDGKRQRKYLRGCYALFPEYVGERRLSKGYRLWREKDKRIILQKTVERAERELSCRECILPWGGTIQELPTQLYAAYLYSLRPFERVCISLPEDSGGYARDQLLEVLLPYLPRIREIACCGEENGITDELGDFLYQEYGMPMQRVSAPRKDILYLEWDRVLENTLKFLDTRIKSGYNTKVN